MKGSQNKGIRQELRTGEWQGMKGRLNIGIQQKLEDKGMKGRQNKGIRQELEDDRE